MGYAQQRPELVAMWGVSAESMRRLTNSRAGLERGLSGVVILVSLTLCLGSGSLLAGEVPPPPSPPSLDTFKEGEALLSDEERWASPGFRLSLHGLYGELSAEDEARAALLRGIEVSAGGRLEPRWG